MADLVLCKGKSEYKSGTGTGTPGSNVKTITLGFRPEFVSVSLKDGTSIGRSIVYDARLSTVYVWNWGGAVATLASAGLTITDTGFSINLDSLYGNWSNVFAWSALKH